MRALILGAAAALLFVGSAVAGPVTLRVNPADADGQVTFGDVFDGAGAASGVVIGVRAGPSVVFEAGQLQSLARQSGLDWANPNGLRRVVVRRAGAASTAPAAPVMAAVEAPASPAISRTAQLRAARAERVISRNDMVRVAFEAEGVQLSITGRAQGSAAVGESLAVLNLQSGRTIAAVAVGPGRAVAGVARAQSQQFAAR